MESIRSDELRLTWDSRHNHMTEFFKMLYKTDCYADVNIIVEGHTMRLHKIVMAMCSLYFHDMFTQATSEERQFKLAGITIREMKWMVEYMYLGSIKIQIFNLENFMKVANKFKMKILSVDNQPADHTFLAANQPKRIKIPPVSQPQMPISSWHQFQLPQTQASQVPSIFTNALSPLLTHSPFPYQHTHMPITDSIFPYQPTQIPINNFNSLQYLTSLTSDLLPQQMPSPFVHNQAPTLRSTLPTSSYSNQSNRNSTNIGKCKSLNIRGDPSFVLPTNESHANANMSSPVIPNKYWNIIHADLSASKQADFNPKQAEEELRAIQQHTSTYQEMPETLQMSDRIINPKAALPAFVPITDCNLKNVSNNTNIDKENGEENFPPNNYELESLSAHKIGRSLIDEAMVNNKEEATTHNTYNDRIETPQTEPIPGNSSIYQLPVVHGSHNITEQWMDNMSGFPPSAEVIQSNELLGLH